MKNLLIILLAITITSCSPAKRITRHLKAADRIARNHNHIELGTTVYDSIVIIDTLYKDRIIYVDTPNDTITETITLTVVDNKIKDLIKKFNSKYLTVICEVKNNEIYLNVTINKAKFKVLIKDIVIKVTKTITTTKTIVMELTWWQKALMWCGRIMLLGCLIVFVVVGITMKNKLFK